MGCKKKSPKQGKKNYKEHVCIRGLRFKELEDDVVTGLVATTHPDRVGDILSVDALNQIATHINDTSSAGGDNGAYRSVSLYHDWIVENDPTKDEAGFLLPNARVVELTDGHYGVEVDCGINQYYRGDLSAEEIKYRVENKSIAGFSIEYDTNNAHCGKVNYDGKEYRFIRELTEFGGVGFARGRMIANPQAIIYKEIADKYKEASPMTEEEKVVEEAPQESPPEEPVAEAEAPKEEAPAEAPAEEEVAEEAPTESETKEKKDAPTQLNVKEILASKEFKEAVRQEVNVKPKVMKEAKAMETVPLSIKEMNASLEIGNFNPMKFKEAARQYFAERPEIDMALKTGGVPLNTTLNVKCAGSDLVITGKLQTKDTLDTGTNAGAYTESSVELADVFLPGIIETFNQKTSLWGNMPKRDHLEGGNTYGWRITTDQSTGLSVDPDDVTVTKDPVNKLKLRTDIKEYRIGVSVTDYMLHHSRAAIGDLMMIEVEKRAADLMKDLNGDLFTEQVDTAGNQVLGLEAVADSAGNTAMYGKTRSTANRLAPASATDTYTAVGGALTTANMRLAVRSVEVDGARRADLRFVMGPAQRDALFELEDGNQNYFTAPRLGFDGPQVSYDGIPVIVDSDCQTDAIFVVDFDSYYAVVSRPPQMIGLAKVGAAEEAYVSIYVAIVYEKPRRCYMLDTLS